MKFYYQARTKKGEIQTGVIEASSKETALAILQKYDLFVTALERAEAVPFYARKIKFFERVSKKDLVNFSRQLSIMFKSKISLLEALRVLAYQTKKIDFKEKILILSEDIEGGIPLSQALSRYPQIFSPFFISMVKSGEASGNLSQSLDYLANHLEKEYYLSSKIKGAMIYPALVVILMGTVLIMMMYFVIPDLVLILKETGQELPLLTKIVIALSDFFKKWLWALLIIFVGLSGLLFYYSKTSTGKKFLDKLYLRLPFINTLLKKIYLVRFAENLATLIKGGLPIVKALEIAEVVGNEVYQDIISQIKEKVKSGERMSAVLVRHPEEFPPVFTQMVVVGEKTGGLSETLINIVDFYQKEVDRVIDNLLRILEPLLIIFLGVIVGGLMASILMPLYRITTL